MDIRPTAPLGGVKPNTGQKTDAASLTRAAGAIAASTLPQQSTTQGIVPILPVNMAEQALAYAQIPLTEETMQMIETLIGNEMPIDKDALAAFYQLTKAHPDTDVETLALMYKHDIPVTKENIEAFIGYRNLEHKLMDELTHLIDTLPQLAGELPAGMSITDLLSWNDTLVSLLFGADDAAQSAQPEMAPDRPPGTAVVAPPAAEGGAQTSNSTGTVNAEQGAQMPVDALPAGTVTEDGIVQAQPADANATADATPPAADSVSPHVRAVLKEALRSGDPSGDLLRLLDSDAATPKEVVKAIASHLRELPRTQGDERAQVLIKALLTSEGYGELLREGLKSELLLKPEQFQKQEVTAFYQKIYDNADRIATELGALHGELAQSLSQAALGVRNNLEFLGDLAQSFSYLDLPLHLSGEYVQGDLYVFKNRKRGGIDPDDLRVLLHLDLGELGLLDVYINLQGQTVRSNFYADHDTTVSLIADNLPTLEDALRDKGFTPRVEARPRTGQEGDAGFDFVRDFLEQHSAGNRVEHYSLNIKV